MPQRIEPNDDNDVRDTELKNKMSYLLRTIISALHEYTSQATHFTLHHVMSRHDHVTFYHVIPSGDSLCPA